LHDAASGLHLRKGCQTLDGGEALSFVRTGHQFASQDLQREQNQRVFIKALLSKLTSPGVILNPFAVIPAATGSVDSLSVDNGTHLKNLISVAFALRAPETTTVPVANSNYSTSAGDAVLWDSAKAGRLFRALNTDSPLPKRLVTGCALQACAATAPPRRRFHRRCVSGVHRCTIDGICPCAARGHVRYHASHLITAYWSEVE